MQVAIEGRRSDSRSDAHGCGTARAPGDTASLQPASRLWGLWCCRGQAPPRMDLHRHGEGCAAPHRAARTATAQGRAVPSRVTHFGTPPSPPAMVAADLSLPCVLDPDRPAFARTDHPPRPQQAWAHVSRRARRTEPRRCFRRGKIGRRASRLAGRW